MEKVPENPLKNRKGDYSPLLVVSSLLVMLYITSNVMAVKIISIGNLSLFDAGTITFPFAYMLGDVLAEIWGYKTAKKVIYITFLCNVAFIAFTSIGIILPYPEYMQSTQDAYTLIYSYVPRIVFSSLLAFLSGELMNAKVLVKIKEMQREQEELFESLEMFYRVFCLGEGCRNGFIDPGQPVGTKNQDIFYAAIS